MNQSTCLGEKILMKLLLKKTKVLILLTISSFFTYSNVEAMSNHSVEVNSNVFKTEAISPIFHLASVNSAHDQTYQNILKSLLNLKDSATFPADQIYYGNVDTVINEVLENHPEIFYFQHNGTYIYSNGTIKLKYKYSKATIKKMVNQLNSKVNYIIKKQTKPKDSDFAKVKAIHDYIVLHSKYDTDNYLRGTVPDLSYTSYGLIINHVAVCDGYAKAMKLILDHAGVKNYYVTGYGGSDLHAWNLVRINKKYYYVDTTWDDPIPDDKGHVNYQYFLMSASELMQTHSWSVQDFPASTSKQYDYFHEFGTFQETKTYYYYSHKDSDILYRVKKDGSQKTKILNVRAPYFAISGNIIYFSNYSNGGYLYKAKIDGSGISRINNVYSTDLYIQKNYLYFKNGNTGELYKMKI